MEKFLARTAKYILDKHGNNLSGVTVLMPNHRSCVYFRQALRDATQNTVWSPELTTLQDWIFDKSKIALIEPLEQIMELFEVYKERGGEETFDEFLSTAPVMLADFDEVDMQQANAKSFFSYLEQLQSLKVYEPGGEPSDYTIQYKRFWQLFRELYFALRERLLAKQKGYTGMIFRDVADNIDSVIVDSSRIYLIGFSSLHKTEEVIVKTLRDNGLAEVVWDSDKYYVESDFQEAGTSFRKYKNSLKVDTKEWQNDLIATQAKKIHVVGVAKNIGQTKVVADILYNKLGLDERTEKQTAVVVPDERLLSPLLAAMPSNITALNISMGLPLYESSIAELLKAIFSLHENVERFQSAKEKRLRFYFRDVFDILHHPYASFLLPDKRAIGSFIEEIRERNRMLISYNDLTNQFKDTAVDKLFWFTDQPKEYLDKLLELVDALRVHFLKYTRSERRNMSVDIELLYYINNTMKNLKNVLQEDNLSITVPSLRKLILENIRSQRVPFEGEPIKGLQIMGMLETRSLDFKNVVILSMNEGIVPSGKTQRSYIPYEMRREYLTTHQDKDANAAYLFYRLLQRAENVFLLYNTESDEMGGGEKSRFILQLQHELKSANPNIEIIDQVYSVDPPPAIPEDEINITKDDALMHGLTKTLSEYGISPSAVNSYIHCTLQYYFRYVAGFRQEDDLEESMEASTLGSAVHSVLENLYTDVLNKDLTPEFIEGISKQKEKINELLKAALHKRFDEESLKSGKNYLLYRVCLKLIDEFLKQEKRTIDLVCDSGNTTKLLLLEKEMVQPFSAGGQQINVRGKVDRVEECGGIISVVDYKTGTPAGSSIKSDDMALFATDPKYAKAMQLLTYAWLYWRTNGSPDLRIRSGIYWLRDITKGFDSLKMDREDILNPVLLVKFEEVLQTVLAQLVDRDIPFSKTPDRDRCTHCEFIRICRRG